MFDSLIITDEDALEAGLTHRATLYGVDVYVANPNSDDIAVACKFMPLMLWTSFIDLLVEAFLWVVPSDSYFELPLKNIKKIGVCNG